MKYLFGILLMVLVTSSQGKSIYVDKTSIGLRSGESWQNAFMDLNRALEASQKGDTIFVAEGIYFPTEDTNREKTFKIDVDITIIGGISKDETRLYDPSKYLTILSGDIGIKNDFNDNSHTVLEVAMLIKDLKIDGIIIEGGKFGRIEDSSIPQHDIAKSGAGVFIHPLQEDASIEFTNCIFRNNQGGTYGGALFARNTDVIKFTLSFKQCYFEKNESSLGGSIGVLGYNSKTLNILLNKCSFFGNRASQGGAIYRLTRLGNNSSCYIEKCIFTDNLATNGGAINNSIGSNIDTIVVKESKFISNSVSGTGGGLSFFSMDGERRVIEILDSEFIENITDTDLGTGGSIFLENTNSGSSSKLIMKRNIFKGNISGSGGVIHSLNFDYVISNCLFDNNYAKGRGGVIDISNSLLGYQFDLSNNTFSQNRVGLRGGVIHAQKNTNPSLTNNFSISNCIFNKNLAGIEGQIGLIQGANMNFNNCLIDIENCNTAIAYDSFFSFNVVTCNQVIFDSDSPFIDEINKNFTLSPCSPAINAGNNDFASDLPTDLNGNPRIQEGQVDLGAYEAPPMKVAIALVRNSCSGADDGQVLFEIENACAPYEVVWERGSTSGSGEENLAAGDYKFTITDSRGRSQEQSATIAENPALEVNFTTQNASAADLLDGAVVVENISGGQAPYQVFVYDVMNEQFRNQDNLQVGNYQLIIKDANGCEQIYEFVIDVLSNTAILEEDILIQLVPNPVAIDQNALLNIVNPNHHHLTITLFDAQGRLLQEQQVVRATALNLMLPEMAGLYFVKVVMENGASKVLKLVKL